VRAAVAEIVRSEGFLVNAAKSQLMTNAGRQRVCGVVVNARTNVPRTEYDTLKAILHNAAARGTEIDRAHLVGRIAWIESLNPSRGAKLRARLAAIRPAA
jgi:RNA-directed DNA polymerase